MQTLSILAVLLLFLALGVRYFWNVPGDDLASSYIGCRIVATGQTSALFSYDPESFADISDNDTVWAPLATQGHYYSWLHPYVQTPLWAWSLQPLCNHIRFGAFKITFLAAALISIAAYTWLVARFWTPRLFHPLAIALILLALWSSQPFGYAMYLVQTHALILLLTVAGLLLADRDRPILAGLLVAIAAAVKLTPAILLVYWLFNRKWRAALSLALVSCLLLLLTRFAVGPHLLAAYFANLHRVSRVLLVTQNNQSLASWVMTRFYPPDEITQVDALPLPTALRLTSTALMLLTTTAAAVLDRSQTTSNPRSDTTPSPNFQPPLGAVATLVAMTVFAPIAWTHYYILLPIPIMVLLQQAITLRPARSAWLLVALIALIAVFNYYPLATDIINFDIHDRGILRGQFYAGILSLVALALAAWLRHQRSPATNMN